MKQILKYYFLCEKLSWFATSDSRLLAPEEKQDITLQI